MAGVTQVVGAGEGHLFHNRLTHSLEVAQIARRLAQRLASTAPSYCPIDPDVVEAAALAHDLGHPPFGHMGEKTLNELADGDGFEGNAQSFRIVARLAEQRPEHCGLDLTRATLNAVLKYPWLKGEGPLEKGEKFGAYRSDSADFEFAREGSVPKEQSVEAAIMDISDSVAYSVHDLHDFYRAGIIPLAEMDNERRLNEEIDHCIEDGKESELVAAHRSEIINVMFLGTHRYSGSRADKARMRAYVSLLITRLISSVEIVDSGSRCSVKQDDQHRAVMRFLQNLVWRYVITSPRLATQQAGQRRIIRDLFEV